jgi:hypothetical protein
VAFAAEVELNWRDPGLELMKGDTAGVPRGIGSENVAPGIAAATRRERKSRRVLRASV